MTPHLHITIASLSLLSLFSFYVAWSLIKLRNMQSHIDAIHDFVKFKAKLELARDNPSDMMTLYRDYIDADDGGIA
tara:strand:+ start:1122 stop:1349 length:228 start_codon:yes stop_codon:yes gene_type:complete